MSDAGEARLTDGWCGCEEHRQTRGTPREGLVIIVLTGRGIGSLARAFDGGTPGRRKVETA